MKRETAKQRAALAAMFSKPLPVSRTVAEAKRTTTERAVLYLHKHGRATCYAIGSLIDNRKGRVSAGTGGGDYAAQMLLGRMRKAGLVRVSNYEGTTSEWELTQPGLQLARKLA